MAAWVRVSCIIFIAILELQSYPLHKFSMPYELEEIYLNSRQILGRYLQLGQILHSLLTTIIFIFEGIWHAVHKTSLNKWNKDRHPHIRQYVAYEVEKASLNQETRTIILSFDGI